MSAPSKAWVDRKVKRRLPKPAPAHSPWMFIDDLDDYSLAPAVSGDVLRELQQSHYFKDVLHDYEGYCGDSHLDG